MRFKIVARLCLLICVLINMPTDSAAAELAEFNFQTGRFVLGENLATVQTDNDYAFLSSDEAFRFLTDFWGNPPQVAQGVLGMLIPMNIGLDDPSSYGIIITYEDIGYVSDREAEAIDYDELLGSMQEDVQAASQERVREGYDSIELIGWAKRPIYDTETKKFYWAKQIRFNNAPPDTLNYEIRVLGRRGVLELNVVAAIEALPQIDGKISSILGMIDFNQGETYREFNPDIDRVAAYGLAGLVAGGVLVKTGFFKALIKLLLPFAKLIGVAVIGGVAALVGIIRNFFGRRV